MKWLHAQPGRSDDPSLGFWVCYFVLLITSSSGTVFRCLLNLSKDSGAKVQIWEMGNVNSERGESTEPMAQPRGPAFVNQLLQGLQDFPERHLSDTLKSSQRHSSLWALEIPLWPLSQGEKKNGNVFVFWSDKKAFSAWNCSLSCPYSTDFSLIPVLSDLRAPTVFYCYEVEFGNQEFSAH